MISLAGPSRPVITFNKSMTHIQAHIPSRLTVSEDHTRKQLYPNKTSPYPPPQDINISATWLLHQWSLLSNRVPPPPPPPLPSDNSRLERLDPKGCPPLGRIVSLDAMATLTCKIPYSEEGLGNKQGAEYGGHTFTSAKVICTSAYKVSGIFVNFLLRNFLCKSHGFLASKGENYKTAITKTTPNPRVNYQIPSVFRKSLEFCVNE